MTHQNGDLVLDSVTRRFPRPDGSELTILEDVSWEVASGEAMAIVGPSGSGKSTLLNIIGALDKPTSGTVRLGDTQVDTLEGADLAAFRASRVGFVFQEHHLLPQLSALENVLIPTLARRAGPEAEDLAARLMLSVGLEDRRSSLPAQLSGGERQRVALARAMINEPGLLLCDEPTGNLDRHTGARVTSLLLDLAREHGVTVLVVTHNVEQASRFDGLMQLRDGRLSPTDSASAETGST